MTKRDKQSDKRYLEDSQSWNKRGIVQSELLL